LGREGDARNHYVAVRRLQKPQLHDDQEQEEAFGAFRDEKVLQYVPEADGAQGSEVEHQGAEKD
jgi:hypothetical protein